MKSWLRPAIILAAVVIAHLSPSQLLAEHLPIKIFNSSDGLGSSFIDYLMRDSRGFMWFCTRDGLSRFDGSQFVTYRLGKNDNVSGVESIFEQADGTYWVGTTSGFYRFSADTLSQAGPAQSSRPFLNAEFVDNRRGRMYEDRSGKLWFISNGFWQVAESDGKVMFTPVDLHLPDEISKGMNVTDHTETSDGSFWFNVPKGLVRRLPDGKTIFFRFDAETNQGTVTQDSNGLIWIGRGKELYIMRPEPLESFSITADFTDKNVLPARRIDLANGDTVVVPQSAGEIFKYTSGQFLSRHLIRRIFLSSDKHVWITTEQNLVEFDGRLVHLFTTDQGFVPSMGRMAEDTAGNIWFAGTSGLARLDRHGLTTYSTTDGLNSPYIYSITEDATGGIYAGTGELSVSLLNADGKFESVRPGIPSDASVLWTSPLAYHDREGGWWFATTKGLAHFDGPAKFSSINGALPTEVFNQASGLPNDEAFHVFEDRNGNILFSQLSSRQADRKLVRWDRATHQVYVFSEMDGFPSARSVSTFAEDRHGNVWMGMYEGGLVRYRDGKFAQIDADNGLQSGVLTDLYVDTEGRLWLASAVGGVSLIEDTSADKPVFQRITTENGLSSNNIRTITEDRFGRLYFGTVRGIDRLSLKTMRVKHYSLDDGLAADFVGDSLCDSNGNLWFATTNGISRLTPTPDESGNPPSIFLGKLVIAGEEQSIPELGGGAVDQGELSSNQNNFQIDYFGLDMRAGEKLRYQYKFASDANWSDPTEQRSVTLAKMSPGDYRFLVRAVNSDGLTSIEPAIVHFKILQPIWLRWWFLSIVAVSCVLIVTAFYSYRVANLRRVNEALTEAKLAEEALRRIREEQIKELESVKTRIATDLHDDIGASLTQIAILSEVARAKGATTNGNSPDALQKITDVSNELVGVMSDIVWAINPAKDRFSDLSQRMRRIASDMLSPKGIVVHFRSREEDRTQVVKANTRREAFLIFKESVTNIAKHANAKNIFVDLEISEGLLHLRIEDDGSGFGLPGGSLDDSLTSDTLGGNGLRNMRRRAAEIGGVFDVESSQGHGTLIRLTLPVDGNLA